MVISVSLLLGTLLCVKRVLDKDLQVGDFVLFVTYLDQLYRPLNYFGSYYRAIHQNFIDMEKMLDLLKEKVEVHESPTATNLQMKEGKIVFDNVSFKYDNENGLQTLKNISFEVGPGMTVALVGPSGNNQDIFLMKI